MARERSPNRDAAFELFKKANGNIMNREIAKQLSISEKTVGGWKSKDKWIEKLNGVLQSNERSTPNKVGAPSGNQNGKGNKGGSAPKQNKNAVKTGEHETIFAEYLTDDEKDIYSTMSDNPFFVMSEEVRLLKIRQRRMMKRIAEAEKGLNQTEQNILYELRGRKKIIEKKGKSIELSIPELQKTEIKEKTFRVITDILAIEDALTRISNQLTRAIKQLTEIGKIQAETAIVQNKADKLTNDSAVDELLEALINPKLKLAESDSND